MKHLVLTSATAAVLLVAAVWNHAVAANYRDSATGSYLEDIRNIQEYLFNNQFKMADSLATLLARQYPDDAAGYLFRAITLITRMFDREEETDSRAFHAYVDSTLTKARVVLDTATVPRERAWMHLFAGHALAYRSLWEAHFGSLLRAIKIGRRARDEYRQGLICDNTLYDLYFGLGLFNYWKSAKAGLLRTIGLVHNDMDKGMQQLRLAADSSLISRQSARNALVWVWLDRGQYDSVIAQCLKLRDRYPQGKSILWPLGQAYYETGQYHRAAEIYESLRQRLAESPGNYYNLIECDFFLYRVYEKLRQHDRAEAIAARARTYMDEIPGETRHRQRAKIAFLRRAARS